MTRILAALLVLGATALFTMPSYADGLTRSSPIRAAAPEPVKEWSWSGIYLDVGVGGQASIINLDAAGEERSSASINGFGAWDYAANARVGINWQPSGTPFVYGVFAGYSAGDVSIDASIGGSFASATITPTWELGGIVGVVGPYKSLLYGGYRYQHADFDLSANGKTITSADLEGHGAIAGMKMPLTNAFVLGLEYGYERFDDVHVGGVTFQPEVHTVMLRGTILIGPNIWN